MAKDDLFCGECGGDTRGVICPSCGTLSFRSFCPSCNAAVDELGQEELDKASADPVFMRICELAEKIVEVTESGILSEPQESELSPELLSLLNRYRTMQGRIADTYDSQNDMTPDFSFAEQQSDKEKGIILTASSADLSDIPSAIEELNALMKSMIPDPGLTPQMQRNYYSARKVAVYRKSIVRETVGWVCNLCGCHHRSPSECARPELGGRWIYQDKEITTKTYE